MAIVHDALYEAHDPGPGHPESPQRLRRIMDTLQNRGMFNRATLVRPGNVTHEQLSLIHSKNYIDFVLRHQGEEGVILDSGDTRLSVRSVDVALLAAGAAVTAVDLIFQQSYDKVFAAVRPPGHHARPEAAMGFCVFNNIALAARYARTVYGVSKILIVDWDVHHGNGTQEIFYHSADVFYLSLHQYPLFPMTGQNHETGEGPGKGFTLNVPLPPGQTDADYALALEQALGRVETRFQPELILISAGFDAFHADSIAGMLLTEDGFYKLTELVARFAQRYAHGHIISFLEGGYHLQGLANSVNKHLQCLLKH